MNFRQTNKGNASHTGRHANQSLHCSCFFQLIIIIFLVLYIFINPIYGQVYNYIPINHNDIETNPSILASESMNSRIQILHQNTFSSINSFSFNSLRLSKYFESSFFGIGLSINNTNMDSNICYNHIGLGAGYRNVLFNKVYIKFGVTYKLIKTNSTLGNFEYYSFSSSSLNNKKKFKDNLNLALSFSSPNDRYYVSFGLLNFDLLWNETKNNIQFPTYYVINVGNLMSIFDKRNSEISYTAFSKLSEKSNKTTYSHYMNFKFHIQLTRKAGLNYGSRIGFAENDYFHFIPFITYYRKKLVVNLSYSFHLNKMEFQSKYFSTNQINVIYIL